jgi:glycosyltransferase involved in cell wall biosynthesis
MSPMPRVSIVIPVYNGANYLREAIDSALAQTSDDIEVIVVNDGSRDGGATAEIARSYGDRIRYIEKENGGVSSALNRGIAAMRGEWFCWLSHDDRYLPEKTATQLAFLARNPDVRAVGCNLQKIDAHGNVVGENHEHLSVVRNGAGVLTSWIYGCGLMIHRSTLDAAGPFNESNRTTQDLEMWLRIVERDPIYLMPEILTQFRVHEEAGSRTESRYQQDKDDLFARMMARYDATYFDPDATTSRRRAEVYWLLARNALSRDAWGGARLATDRAWTEDRSFTNPALLAHLLGPQKTAQWWRIRERIIRTSRRTLRRLVPDALVTKLRARRSSAP